MEKKTYEKNIWETYKKRKKRKANEKKDKTTQRKLKNLNLLH